VTPGTHHLWAFSALIAKDAEAGRLHPRHLQILGALCAEVAPIKVTDLAAALGIEPQSLSRHALRLAALGLLKRSESRTDRRITLLAPTKQGRALNDRVMAVYAATAPLTVSPAA
jgi:DNA-binding MarR family transcriptional regulator